MLLDYPTVWESVQPFLAMRTFTARGQRKRTFKTPAEFVISSINGRRGNIVLNRQFFNGGSVLQTPAWTLIFYLLFAGCPTNISFFVMTIVINSIQRQTCVGAFANIFNKFVKRIKAKFNTSPTIPFVGSVVRICATIFGGFIGAIRWIIYLAFGSASTLFVFDFVPFRIAATRTGIVSEQSSVGTNSKFPTITFAIPFAVTQITNNSQKGELPSFKVFKVSMRWFGLKSNVKIFISHIVSYIDNVIRLARDVQNLWRAVSILPRNLCKTYILEVFV